MAKVLKTKSTLTDRYQTTIPEAIRDVLHLGKRDKISYAVENDGKVIISRATENDPDISHFLSFLISDIKNNPTHLKSIIPVLHDRIQQLISDVEIDLDAPLSEKDE